MEAKQILPPAVVVGGLTALRCLGRSKPRIPLYLATSIANKSAFHSKYVTRGIQIPGPSMFPDEFVDNLCQLGETFGNVRPALFYDGDADLLCVSRNRERLARYYGFVMPDSGVIEQLLDKTLFREFSALRDLPVPASCTLKGNSDPADLPKAIKFPLIIKPVSRVGWFMTEAHKMSAGGKAIRVDDMQQLRELLSRCEETGSEMLVQQLVQGGEENIVSYHSYVNHDGKILGDYCGRKHRTYPLAYGLSSCVEVCDLPEIRKAGQEILEKTGLSGVSKMDFKIDSETGEVYLLEINPRFSIWNYPGAVAGVNLPLLVYKDICGQLHTSVEQKKIIPCKWVDGKLDFQALREESGSALIAFIRVLRNLPSRTVYYLWSWKDPLPFFYVMYDLARRAVRKSGHILSSLPGRIS